MKERRTAYRVISLLLAVGFAAAGCVFLLFPDETLTLLRGGGQGAAGGGAGGGGAGDNRYFLILASAYMYVVTVLAWSMYRSPGEPIYPLLLAQAKGASAVLSFCLFLLQKPLPIYLANGAVDTGLALLVLMMFRGVARSRRRCDRDEE